MAPLTVKTRVLIISDTHCASLQPQDGQQKPQPPFQDPLPSADLLIHCGDLTHTGELEEYHETLDMLSAINAPVKLVIAGNHDLTLDRHFVLGHMQRDHLTPEQAEFKVKQARDLWTASDSRAKMEGVTFLNEGHHHVQLLNGATINVYASPYTPEFYDWGFPYERDQDRYNAVEASLSDAKNVAINPVQVSVDIMITHGPPFGRLDRTNRGELAGCPHTLRAIMRTRPLIHCYGHIHEGWGAEVSKWNVEAIDASLAAPPTIAEWKSGCEAGIASIDRVDIDLDVATASHAAFLDLSSSGKSLVRGEETALINAAIMDVRYKPSNAPWLVEVDLPTA